MVSAVSRSTTVRLSFRLARNDAEDAARFCALSNSLYARPVDPAYYRWQFFSPPFPSALLFALTDGEELAGCYGVQVRDTQDPAVRVAWAIDMMVHPAHQGQGVFRALVERATEFITPHHPSALCVMANERADAVCVQGLKWQRINTFTTFLRETRDVDPPSERLDFTPLEHFGDCAALLAAGSSFYADGSGQPLIANARSVAYLDWRFVANRRYDYERYAVGRGGSPIGYLVLKTFRDPGTGQAFGDLVDLVSLEPDRTAVKDVFLFALRRFASLGVPRAATWLQSNGLLDEIGQGVGFRESGQKRYFCGTLLDARHPGLTRADRWFVTMADAEIY